MYNTLVKLGSLVSTADYQPTMSESDFPLTLFESCKGETDPQTGVPPALCTVQWTFTPTKPAQVLDSLTNFRLDCVQFSFNLYTSSFQGIV